MAPRRLLLDGVSAAGLCHGESCVIAVEFVRNAAWLLNCQGLESDKVGDTSSGLAADGCPVHD